MPMPYVISATINQENKLVLTVKIDDEFTTGEPLEISGHATQNGGAFAVFNVIKNVPDRNPDGTAYIYVTATPSQPFVKGHPVTVVLRAATVWATVLKEPQPEPVPELAQGTDPAAGGTSWSVVSKVSYATPPATGSNGHAPTGVGASFPDD